LRPSRRTRSTRRTTLEIGGLTNNSGAGKTGAISFTTLDQSAGDAYTVVLEMQKHYVNPMG
jgi:hypothetical protein